MRKKLWKKSVAAVLIGALLTGQYGDFGTKNTVEAGVADEFAIPGTVNVQANPEDPNARYGAKMPYVRYDSENPYATNKEKDKVTLGGGANIKKSANWDRMNIASQASNQAYVSLPSNGSYVEWDLVKVGKKPGDTSDIIGDGVTMRFTMPDSGDGMGKNGSLDVYVNGRKVKTVSLTSYFMWQYFSGGNPSDTNDGGAPGFAFDEVHFKLDQKLKEGDKIRIQSTGEGGMEYGVDFLEIENVPDAIEQPGNSVNVLDYGAVPNDGRDDYDAIYRATAYADSHGMDVYIPEGTFEINQIWRLYGSDMKVTGAGIWYTNIQFTNSNRGSGGVSCGWGTSGTSQDGYCKNIEFCNMYLNSNLRSRYNQEAVYKGFMDVMTEESVVHDIWEEHFETGFWFGDYNGKMDYSDGVKVINSRIRNNLADGVNFCQGTSNATVYNCSIRNNGDDGLAMWNDGTMNAKDESNNVFAFNTIDFIWRAGAIAIYGGNNHKIYNNYMRDVFMSAGIHLNTTFPGYKFNNNNKGITFDNNVLVRCGTAADSWNEDLGAVDIKQDTKNVTFNNTYIYDSPAEGIRVFGNEPDNIVFNNTVLYGSGLSGQIINYSCINHSGVAIRQGSDKTTYNNIHIANVAEDSYKGTGQENRSWPYFTDAGSVGNLSNADIKEEGFTYSVPDYPDANQNIGPDNIWENIVGANFKVTELNWRNQDGDYKLKSGDQVTFRVKIKNTSGVDVPSGQVLTTKVIVDEGASYSNIEYRDGLRPGQTVELTMTTKCTLSKVGKHTFKAQADFRDYLHETDEDDNYRIKRVNVQEGPSVYTPVTGGYDLQVLKIKYDKDQINAGDKVRFSAVVVNAGDRDIPAGEKIGLQFQIDGQPYPAPITWCDTFKNGLKKGEIATLTANGGNSESDGTWVAEAGTHRVTAWIDDTNGYQEVNENNNEFSVDLAIPYNGIEFWEKSDLPDDVIEPETTTEEVTTQEITTQEVTTAEITTAHDEIVVSDDVKVEGYQVSATHGGARTIGSVPKTVNGKQVVGRGIVYALTKVDGRDTGVQDQDMQVNSDHHYVRAYNLTNESTLSLKTADPNRTYFAVTMLFANGGSKKEFEATYKTRTYVQLADGFIVYSNISDYSIYRISDVLYQNQMMGNRAGHDYLYEKILKVVNPSYEEVDYDWNKEVVKF